MSTKVSATKEGVAEAFYSWLQDHPVSNGEILVEAIEKAVSNWLDDNEETIIKRIAEATRRNAPSITAALEESLDLLVKDGEKRGSMGQEVNWAAIHHGREMLNLLRASRDGS